jgi:hypothetical protein
MISRRNILVLASAASAAAILGAPSAASAAPTPASVPRSASAAPAPSGPTANALPTRNIITHHTDGTVTVRKGPDFTKSPIASVRAKAADVCPSGYICLFSDHNAGGEGFAWEAGSYGSDHRNISCAGCRNGKHGNDGTFNDQMSSWVNATGDNYYWYFDIGGRGERHLMQSFGTGRVINQPARESDEASSLYME